VAEAIGWGALAASSLVIGPLLAFAFDWPRGLVGLVLAFGAGALISAVSYELAQEGLEIGSPAAVGAGLAVGAIAFYLADGRLAAGTGSKPGRMGRMEGENAGRSLALGAFLDGIPEQLVLGIGLAGGHPVSVALVVAIFVSNLPEGIGAAIDMRKSGTAQASIIKLFVGVAVVCTVAAGIGYALANAISSELQAALNGFAAGALLVMLIDSMIPEAKDKGGRAAGLAAVVGFAAAASMSAL
jgi:ZIP family zinc transporter